MLIGQLPRESATARASIGNDVEWSLETHLAAAQVDALHAIIWQNGSGKGQKPTPIPRPGVTDGKDRTKIGDGVGRSTVDIDTIIDSVIEQRQLDAEVVSDGS